jgi:hypothetical protein
MPYQHEAAQSDYDRCILGRTSSGDYGLPFLLRSLGEHGLKAVFFTESLFASALGLAWLERVVSLVQSSRQEVQLHVHTEWLSDIAARELPPKRRQNLKDFELTDQAAIIAHALANLRGAGATNVSAFRAGNLGGNRDTLVAAHANGLTLDMSFSWAHGNQRAAEWCSAQPYAACPTVPLPCVEDFVGQRRPAQLTALSWVELQSALIQAERAGWPAFVILLHGSELVCYDRKNPRIVRPHRINILRWKRLCDFLTNHRDRFVTIGCEEANSLMCAETYRFTPVVRSSVGATLWRIGEQLLSRAW